jgi:hypothetical protein
MIINVALWLFVGCCLYKLAPIFVVGYLLFSLFIVIVLQAPRAFLLIFIFLFGLSR